MATYPGAAQSTYVPPFASDSAGENAPAFRLASRWRRFWGFQLDGVFLAVPMVVLGLMMLLPVLLDAERVTLADGTSKFTARGLHDIEHSLVLMVTATTILAAAYTIALTGLCRGQTFAKMALHTRVVRIADGRPVGLGGSALRYGVFAAPGIVQAVLPFVGVDVATGPSLLFSAAQLFIAGWLVWDPFRQGLHDKAAGTVVIDTNSEPEPEPAWQRDSSGRTTSANGW